MNIQFLQWGLFCFILGLFISLPVAIVFYGGKSKWQKLFTNPKKLLSAHIDYFMQASSLGLVYLLEYSTQSEFPIFVVVLLVFGAIFNPTILLLESTPVYRSGLWAIFYQFLKATSPVSLLVAWFYVAWQFLPAFMLVLFLVFALIVVGLMWKHRDRG